MFPNFMCSTRQELDKVILLSLCFLTFFGFHEVLGLWEFYKFHNFPYYHSNCLTFSMRYYKDLPTDIFDIEYIRLLTVVWWCFFICVFKIFSLFYSYVSVYACSRYLWRPEENTNALQGISWSHMIVRTQNLF